MADFLSLSKSSKNSILTLIVFVLAFDLPFMGQKLGGAYQNEFGGHPHEASHYMAGLFWRDLAVSIRRDRAEGKREPLSEAKRSFTQNWDAHYPYLETGSERSLFHGLEAVWMLAFPATRGSLLVLLAVISGVLATQLYRVLHHKYGWAGAALAAAALLALPSVRKFTGLVMPDILSSVLIFGAAIAFGDFLDREKARDAWLAGLLGGLAILNSESSFVVWMVMLLAFVMMRKLRLLRRAALWGMCVLIVAASVLRFGLSRGHVIEVALPGGGFAYQTELHSRVSSADLIPVWSALGWGLAVLMLIGLFVKMRREGDFAGRWLAAGALLVGSILSRSSLPALPAALMFALAGGAWLVQWVAARPAWHGQGAKVRVGFPALLGALLLLSAVGPLKREPCTGFAPLVETLIADSAPEDVTLVSSDASGEERFIAELAMRETWPGHRVLCGTRLLANPGKKFIADEPAFMGDQAVFDFLTSGRIKYIALDDAIPDEERREHHYQMERAIEEHLNRFWAIANSPMTRDGVTQTTPARLYKIKGVQ